MSRSPQECDDPGRRWFLFKLPFLTAGGLMFLSAACQGKTDELDSLLKTPLKLPPEPKTEEFNQSLEVLKKQGGGYLYAEVVSGKDNPGDPFVIERHASIFLRKSTGEKIKFEDNKGLGYIDYGQISEDEIALLSQNNEDFKLTLINSQREEQKSYRISLQGEKFSWWDFLDRLDLLGSYYFSSSLENIKQRRRIAGSKGGDFISLGWAGIILEKTTGRIVYQGEKPHFCDFYWSPQRNEAISTVFDFDRDKGVLILSCYFIDLSLSPKASRLLKQVSSENSRLFWQFCDWSPDGENFILLEYDSREVKSPKKQNSIVVFNRQGEEIKSLEAKGLTTSIQFSPDGNYVAFLETQEPDVSSRNVPCSTSLIIWEFKTGQKHEIPVRQYHPLFLQEKFEGEFLYWFSDENLLLIPPRVHNWDTEILEPAKFLFLSKKELLSGKVDLTKEGQREPALELSTNFMKTDYSSSRLALELVPWSARDSVNYREKFRLNQDLAVLDLKTKKIKKIDNGRRLVFLPEKIEIVRQKSSSGDVATEDEENFYRLLNEKRYSLNTTLETFKQKSGFKGQTLEVTEKSLQDIPEGVIAGEIAVFDWAGRPRRNNKEGGRKVVYGPGLLTKTGAELPLDVSLDSTFLEVRKTLRDKGYFQEEDSLYFTYDPRKNWFGYKNTDTMQDPLESIALFSRLIKEWKEAHPLDNLNLICHSLGGVVALHAAYEHLEIINNIITLDSPLRGLPAGLDKNILELLLPALGEKVISFLLRAWDDRAYQERLKQIMAKAKERGVGIYTFASTDDLIVPWQSAVLDGATETIGEGKIELAFPMGINLINPLNRGHGQVLDNAKILGYISEIVGKRNF